MVCDEAGESEKSAGGFLTGIVWKWARGVRRGNIINFHGCVVITIIKFPRGSRRVLSPRTFAGREVAPVIGRDGTGYRSPGAAN